MPFVGRSLLPDQHFSRRREIASGIRYQIVVASYLYQICRKLKSCQVADIGIMCFRVG